MNTRSIVLDEMQRVAREQSKKLKYADGTSLIDTGLDSLCFAVLVARLEDKLGADPFSAADGDALPITVGDFIRFYEDFSDAEVRSAPAASTAQPG